MDNILVHDVLEAYVKGTASGKEYFFGLTTQGDVVQKVKQELLRAGIGNSVQGVLQSDKEITFKIATLFNNSSIMEIQNGKEFVKKTRSLQKSEKIVCKEKKLVLTEGTPIGDKVLVQDSKGVSVTATYDNLTKTATSAELVDGAEYVVIYSKENANAEVLDLSTTAFPQNYYVELHTIAYNKDTSTVIADIYWVFYKALPDGGINAQYQAGKSNGNEINFTAISSGGSYGEYIIVPRE